MTARTPARPTYLVRLRPEPGVDAARALRRALKILLRYLQVAGDLDRGGEEQCRFVI
jgi:hypothetical protein